MPASLFSFSLATPLLFSCLGVGHLGVWLMWRSRTELAWLGVGFLLATGGVLAQLLAQPPWMVECAWLAALAYMAAAMCAGQALALRLCVPMPWTLVVALNAGLLLWLAWNLQQPAWHPLWLQGFMWGCMWMAAAPLVHWQQLHTHNRFDRWLRGLYAVAVVLSTARLAVCAWLWHQHDPAAAQVFEPNWSLLCMQLVYMGLGMAAAGAMFFAVLHDELRELHRERQQDPLTQLLNRRGFVEHVQQQGLQAQQATPQQWSLLVCDLDHFKQVNDRWGHMVGDEALRSVAQLLKARVRTSDVVARFGGEEFVVLLPGHDVQQARQVAERIRDGVARLRIPELQGERLTVSIGAVQLAGVHMTEVEQGLRAADAQMYVAKRNGRNRVMGVDAGDNTLVI